MPPNTLDLLAAPGPVQQNWLSQEDAIQEVVVFARQFGLKHLRLACHAALPMLVTPELVNLIRLNLWAKNRSRGMRRLIFSYPGCANRWTPASTG